MTTALGRGLILLCFLQSIKNSQALWTNPPFQPPDPIDPAVTFGTSGERTNIELEEEVTHDVCIATVNADGSEKPEIGQFVSGQSNFNLGAVFRKNLTTNKYNLYITKKQDFETPIMQRYRFEVLIGDESREIALNIINIDDNPPIIRAIERSCLIEENYLGTNCSFAVSDVDGWIDQTVITFTSSRTEGSQNFQFTKEFIDNNDYEMMANLNVIKPLDFETIATYILQIKATDTGKNEGNLMTIVQVIDMPDMPPVWTSITASQNIVEKSSNETFQVSATDGDIQINAEINYRIVPEDEDESGLFSVDTTTGLVTINPIDRDTLKKEVFRFLIVAYEKNDTISAINSTIVIIVEDLNDHVPEVTPSVLEIDIEEEKYMTLEFGQPIVISDPDLAENGQYSVRLIDKSAYNWSSAFLIVPNSGYQIGNFTISVLQATLLDYEDENWRNMEIEIEASEVTDKTHVGRRTIKINLINWNDEWPIFANDTVDVAIPEDVARGHPIATMLATDRDVGDNVTHSLMSQRTLTVDEKTGEIVTAQDDALDYESMPVVVVQVVATDLANHKAYATLTINVIDVNDVPPVLSYPTEISSLVEEVGTVVNTKPGASDVDTDAELIFSIDWDKTTAQKSGVLVNQSFYREHLEIQTEYPEEHRRRAEGKIVVTGRIDYESFDVIFLMIVVTDMKTVHNENSTSASLTLNIIDINDNYPKFNRVENLRVSENAPTDTLIGSVTATDADGPQYNQISYFIQPVNGTEDNLVSISSETGTIRVKLDKAIDAEVYEYIHYNVIASDGELNSTYFLSICVIDVNDEIPVALSDRFNSTINIPEKSPTGTPIVTIYAEDADRTHPYNNISYLMNTSYSAPFQYFDLGRFDGFLRVSLTDGHILDRDFGAASYTLNLKLRDNYLHDGITWNSNAIDWMITVILDDINDQIPKLPDLGDPAMEISENTKKDVKILTITADDKDDPATDNTKVSYRILRIFLTDENVEIENNCKNAFKVETEDFTRAIISTLRDLKGCCGTWAIELYAEDRGTDPGPLNDTKIYHINVVDYNYYDPVIVFPVFGQSIALSEDQSLHKRLKTHDKQPLSDFTATDDDFGASGSVTFSISSKTGDDQYFEVVDTDKNSGQLQLKKWPDIEANDRYTITLTATDGGDPPRSVSQDHTVIFVSTLGPKFPDNEWTVWIKENKTGLDFSVLIPEAHDDINIDGGNIVPVYYFIDDKVGDFDYFALNKTTRTLTVMKELDREQQETMNIVVITTGDAEGPPRDPRPDAILNITVIVLDENDNSPVFEFSFYSGGVAAEDNVDKLILAVKATDADLNDTIRYAMNKSSLTTSDSSIADVKDPFSLDTSTGEIFLKFSATSNMIGFFKFEIFAYDEVNHFDKTDIQIYIVSKDNRVIFTFRNNAAFMTEERMFLIKVFNDTFGYICNVDDIKSSVDANDHVMDNVTTVTTHFIDPKDNLPIAADVIILASSNLQTVTNLKANLQTRGLYLIDVPTGSSPVDTDSEDRIYWLLLSLTIFFCLTTIALFVAYFIRTRALNQRLDKMALDWKSNDEFAKEKNGAVPTTNQFAVAGSNPIWNIQKKSNFYDNISERSGDSDLIGIEDNPHFDYVNDAFATEEKSQENETDSKGPVLPSAPVIYFDLSYNMNKNNEEKC